MLTYFHKFFTVVKLLPFFFFFLVVVEHYLFGETYFFILNYRHRSHIYFRITILHKSKMGGEERNSHLFGTHSPYHILFLLLCHSPFLNPSIVIMTFLKINKIVAFLYERQTKKLN